MKAIVLNASRIVSVRVVSNGEVIVSMPFNGLPAIFFLSLLLSGCGQTSASHIGMTCQARPSDERIATALQTQLAPRPNTVERLDNIQILGVSTDCNKATVIFEKQESRRNGWGQGYGPYQSEPPRRDSVALIGADNGKWFLAYSSPSTGNLFADVP